MIDPLLLLAQAPSIPWETIASQGGWGIAAVVLTWAVVHLHRAREADRDKYAAEVKAARDAHLAEVRELQGTFIEELKVAHADHLAARDQAVASERAHASHVEDLFAANQRAVQSLMEARTVELGTVRDAAVALSNLADADRSGGRALAPAKGNKPSSRSG